MASREQDGEPETTGTGRDKELSGRALYGENSVGRPSRKVLHQQVLSDKNLQRDLWQYDQWVHNSKADHQSQAAASLHGYDGR